MKRLFYAFLISLICANSTIAATTPDTPAQAAVKADSQQNGEIISWIIAIDSNEVAAAKVAQQKKTDAAVQQYAKMIIDDHTKNLNDAIALSKATQIKPASNSQVFDLIKQGLQQASQLMSTPDVDFSKRFMDAMVTGHTEALAKINSYLTDSGVNPRVADFLKTTRTAVEHHLEAAKSLQANLGKAVAT